MGEVHVVVTYLAEPGSESFIATELTRMMPHIRKEPGLVSYQILRDPTEPRRFVHVEAWANRAAFDAHVVAPHVQDWHLASAGKILDQKVHILQGFL